MSDGWRYGASGEARARSYLSRTLSDVFLLCLVAGMARNLGLILFNLLVLRYQPAMSAYAACSACLHR